MTACPRPCLEKHGICLGDSAMSQSLGLHDPVSLQWGISTPAMLHGLLYHLRALKQTVSHNSPEVRGLGVWGVWRGIQYASKVSLGVSRAPASLAAPTQPHQRSKDQSSPDGATLTLCRTRGASSTGCLPRVRPWTRSWRPCRSCGETRLVIHSHGLLKRMVLPK